MSFKNFKDYLAERTKHPHGVTSDDKGFANRDYDGGLSLKPKPGKHLQPEEYYAPGAKKNPGLMTADGSDRGKAFGDMATPGLTPKNSAPYGEKPADKTKKIGSKKKKKLPTKKAMKVEHFLDKTKEMSDLQFTKHMLADVRQKIPTPKVRDLYGNEFVPEPAQTMKYVVSLMLTNETIMRRMVRELKRSEGLHLLIAEILQQPETYQYLQEATQGLFGELPQRKLALFTEGVSPPRAEKGPASSGAPGGGQNTGAQQGGAFGGGSGPMTAPPAAGISGGPNAGGGQNVNTTGGVKGMGEEGAPPDMGGGKMGDMGGDIEPEPEDDEHIEDDDADDDGDEDLDDDDLDDEDDDEEGEEDEDHGDEEEDHAGAGQVAGMGGIGA